MREDLLSAFKTASYSLEIEKSSILGGSFVNLEEIAANLPENETVVCVARGSQNFKCTWVLTDLGVHIFQRNKIVVAQSFIPLKLIASVRQHSTLKYSVISLELNSDKSVLYQVEPLPARVFGEELTSLLKSEKQDLNQDSDSFIQDLEKLIKMRKEGMLTEEEFHLLKRRII